MSRTIQIEQTAIGERFFVPDGSVHDLYDRPLRCTLCEQPHWWFVNRDGRTRCVHCDDMHIELLAKFRLAECLPQRTQGMGAAG